MPALRGAPDRAGRSGHHRLPRRARDPDATGTKDGILRTRGRLFPYKLPDREVKLLATLHPAFLLRQPVQKRLAWRDFRALRSLLDGKA